MSELHEYKRLVGSNQESDSCKVKGLPAMLSLYSLTIILAADNNRCNLLLGKYVNYPETYFLIK